MGRTAPVYHGFWVFFCLKYDILKKRKRIMRKVLKLVQVNPAYGKNG